MSLCKTQEITTELDSTSIQKDLMAWIATMTFEIGETGKWKGVSLFFCGPARRERSSFARWLAKDASNVREQ